MEYFKIHFEYLEVNNFKSLQGNTVLGPLNNLVCIIPASPNQNAEKYFHEIISFLLGISLSKLGIEFMEELLPQNEPATSICKVSAKILIEDEIFNFERSVQNLISTYKCNDAVVDADEYSNILTKYGMNVEKVYCVQKIFEVVRSANMDEMMKMFDEISGSLSLKENYDQLDQEQMRCSYILDYLVNCEEMWKKMSETSDENAGDGLNAIKQKKMKLRLLELYYIDEYLKALTEKLNSKEESAIELELRLIMEESKDLVDTSKKEFIEMHENCRKTYEEICKNESELEMLMKNLKDTNRKLLEHSSNDDDKKSSEIILKSLMEQNEVLMKDSDKLEKFRNEYDELQETATRDHPELNLINKDIKFYDKMITQSDSMQTLMLNELDKLTKQGESTKKAIDLLKAKINKNKRPSEVDKKEKFKPEAIQSFLDLKEQLKRTREFRIVESLKTHVTGVYGRLVNLCRPIDTKFYVAAAVGLNKNLHKIVVNNREIENMCRSLTAREEKFLVLEEIEKIKPCRILNRKNVKPLSAVIETEFLEIKALISILTRKIYICATSALAKHLANEERDYRFISLDGVFYGRDDKEDVTEGNEASDSMNNGDNTQTDSAVESDDTDIRADSESRSDEEEGNRLKKSHVNSIEKSFEVQQLNKIFCNIWDQKIHYGSSQSVVSRTVTESNMPFGEKKDVGVYIYGLEQLQGFEETQKRILDAIFIKLSKSNLPAMLSVDPTETLQKEITDKEEELSKYEAEIYQDFCSKFGVENINKYRTLRELQENNLDDEIKKIETSLRERRRSSFGDRRSLEILRANKENYTLAVNRTQAKLEKLNAYYANQRDLFYNQLQGFYKDREKYQKERHKFGALKDEIVYLRNQIKCNQERRYDTLLQSKVEDFEIPLLEGSLDNSVFGNETFVNNVKICYDSITRAYRSQKFHKLYTSLLKDIKSLSVLFESQLTDEDLKKMLPEQTKLASKNLKKAKVAFERVKQKRLNYFNKFLDEISILVRENLELLNGNESIHVEFVPSNTIEPYLDTINLKVAFREKKLKSIQYLNDHQKSIAALAMMFAIRSFQKTPGLFLKNITARMNKSKIGDVVKFIYNNSTHSQIFCISDVNELLQKADPTVCIYSTDDEYMGIKMVMIRPERDENQEEDGNN